MKPEIFIHVGLAKTGTTFRVVNKGWKGWQIKLGRFLNQFGKSKFNLNAIIPAYLMAKSRSLISIMGGNL